MNRQTRTAYCVVTAIVLVSAGALAQGCRSTAGADLRKQARYLGDIYRAAPLVRVRLVADADSDSNVTLRVRGLASVYDYKTSEFIGKLPGAGWANVRMSDGKVHIGSAVFDTTSVELVPHRGTRLGVRNRYYDGTIAVVGTGGGKFSIVNALDIETYLRGVVPAEMYADWPAAALRSQAITARTYALWEMASSPSPIYDLTDDAYSQVYRGKKAYRRSTDKAVEATEGIILLYKEQLFPTYYHARCGGHTEDAFNVWGRYDIEPLKGVTDDFCSGERYNAWKHRVPVEAVVRKLLRAGVDVGKLKRIVPTSRSASGRALKLRLEGDATREVSANWFRMLIGPKDIKSTLLTSILRENDYFVFYGKGYGHGVGMCQYGAKAMAESIDEPHTAADILLHYYPSTELIRLY